jgi:hypothetical protein
MSEQEIGSALQLARELVSHLPKEIDDKLKTLILRAEDGQDSTVEIEIMDLLSAHENIRCWLREQINLQSGTRGGYDPLAGKSRPSLPSQKWFCPKSTCAYWMLVIQEGEDPPDCKKHKIKMVRACKKEKKG